MVNEICPTQTRVWIKRGALLVDVREKEEVDQLAFDVPSIINIPLSEFDARFRELPMDRELVMVCRSGARSLRATGFLVNHGYDPVKVVNMKHGILKWAFKGFPLQGDVSILGDLGNYGTCHGHAKHSHPHPHSDSGSCC